MLLLRYNLRLCQSAFGVILMAGQTDFLIERKNRLQLFGQRYGADKVAQMYFNKSTQGLL